MGVLAAQLGDFERLELDPRRVGVDSLILSQVIVIETPIDDVILRDQGGNAYRLVGTARGNFATAADPEDEFALESGFFALKANLSGERGLFGSIDFLLCRQNGNELIRDGGSCHFA